MKRENKALQMLSGIVYSNYNVCIFFFQREEQGDESEEFLDLFDESIRYIEGLRIFVICIYILQEGCQYLFISRDGCSKASKLNHTR